MNKLCLYQKLWKILVRFKFYLKQKLISSCEYMIMSISVLKPLKWNRNFNSIKMPISENKIFPRYFAILIQFFGNTWKNKIRFFTVEYAFSRTLHTKSLSCTVYYDAAIYRLNMSEQNQGTCLSKYMKNCEKKRFSRILLIIFCMIKMGFFLQRKQQRFYDQ